MFIFESVKPFNSLKLTEMNKYITFLAALIIAFPLNMFAQNYGELQNIKLTDSLSCAQAQTKVLECCEYLLTNPCIENLPNANTTSFIIKWMTATPSYTFSLNRKFYKIIESNAYLAGRYHAALAKTAIDNNYTKDCPELQLKAVTLFLSYCEKEKNYVKITQKLRTYIEAKNNNQLKELLN